MNTTSMPVKKDYSALIVLANSFILTFVLFFIDEGYYSFGWATDLKNWMAFMIYFLSLVAAQFVTSELILKQYKGKHKMTLTALIGLPLGLGSVIALLS